MSNWIGRIQTFTKNQRMLVKDIHAGEVIRPLVQNSKYFPITGSSLNLHSVATVINDIIVNGRTNVIEFGAGISTYYIALLIREFSLTTKLTTIDDNAQWLDLMRTRVESEGLADCVDFIHAPLKPSSLSLNQLEWYDEQAIEKSIEEKSAFDVVLVDGPMAWHKSIALSRYPALKFIQPRLADKYSIFLDDIHRKGEKKILNLWAREFGLEFFKVNPAFALSTRGDAFNPIV